MTDATIRTDLAGRSPASVVMPVVTCDGCGVCCLHMSVPPYDDEELEIMEALNPNVYADFRSVEATRKLQLATVGTDFIPCGFLDVRTRRCIHHDYVPDVCGRFVVGDVFCLNFRKDAGLPA